MRLHKEMTDIEKILIERNKFLRNKAKEEWERDTDPDYEEDDEVETDNSAQKGKNTSVLPKKQRYAAGTGWRMHLCMFCLLAIFVALGVKLFKLQYRTQKSDATVIAPRQLEGHATRQSSRGQIVDRNGVTLAMSGRVWGCAMDPALADPGVIVASLRGALEIEPDEAARILEKSRREGCRFVWLKRQLDNEQAELVKSLKLPGVILEPEWQRVYPQGNSACHLVGFTNIDGQGLEGAELVWDKYLPGMESEFSLRRDARRRVCFVDDKAGTSPLPGKKLVLSIDSVIQSCVEEEMRAVAAEYSPKSISAVVMDPYTGDLLAMANWPSFDLNAARETPAEIRLNGCAAEVYEPGSVFKPFIMAGAIEAGVVTPDTEINCENGAWNLGYRVLHDVHPYGKISAEKVIVKSSNIGIAKIGKLLGSKKLYATLRAFGFGQTTGSGLPGELPGMLRPVEKWNPRFSPTSIPMGQEVGVTTLQLTTAFCTVINGGIFVQPRIATGLGDAVYETRPIRRVVSEKTSAKMRSILANVVEHGTGRKALSDEFSIGGKTGTAQIAGPGGYQDGKYIGSFCAFAPVEAPRVVVTFSVMEPQGSYYGGTVSAPAVKNIIETTLRYLKVPASGTQADRYTYQY